MSAHWLSAKSGGAPTCAVASISTFERGLNGASLVGVVHQNGNQVPDEKESLP